MNENASRQYQTQQIMTASPAMLVFMLFEKAITCLKEAVKAIEDKDVEARWKANGRAMEIISHLQLTLDVEKGGEIATNLDRLYGFMLRRLPKVDIRNDVKAAQEVIELLEPLRDSWRELAKQGEQPMRDAMRVSADLARQTASIAPGQPARPAPTPAPAPASQPAGYQALGQRPRPSVDEPKRVMISA